MPQIIVREHMVSKTFHIFEGKNKENYLTSEISKIRIISQGTSEDCQEALAAQNISDHHDVNLQRQGI